MRSLMLGLALVAVIALFGMPVHAQFQDDPGVDTCLGPEDPFCPNPTSGGGGGGGGVSTCYTCKLGSQNGQTVANCEVVGSGLSGWTGCQEQVSAQGVPQCKMSGSSCVSP